MHEQYTPLAVDLTETEQDLVSRIDFDASARSYGRDSWQPISDAMFELMHSLLQRNAVPAVRMRFFTDPACNIGGHGLSRLQVFEKNGTHGDAIFRHGNFVGYLRYFLYGPSLPEAVIHAFQMKVTDCGDPFTSRDALSVADYARQLTRSYGLSSGEAAQEFHKLALDCGLDAHDARVVRDRVQKLRALR